MNRVATILMTIVLLVAACGGEEPATASGEATGPEGRGVVTLLTHESFAVSAGVLEEFTETTGFEVGLLTVGDAGQLASQVALTSGNPLADVVFGVDTTFLSRVLDADALVPYEGDGLDRVATSLMVDERVVPIDFGDVCINYDKGAFTELAPPATLEDLTDPAYRDMLVVENPATSSPGLAFLLATIARFGEDGPYPWRDYWADLRANGIEVRQGWEEAYYGAFSGGSGGGDRPLVVSYASSPPAEVIFATEPTDEAPTGVMVDGCFRQVEYAGVLRGAEQPEGAAALVEFMLSSTFQEDVPLNMFVFPAVESAALPEVFVEHTVVPDDPITMGPRRIDENRDRWIDEWTSIVLR
jgi:thiamine transport system substrate-binding protein